MLLYLPVELLLLVTEELEFNDFWSLCNSCKLLSCIFTFDQFRWLLKIFSAYSGKHCDYSVKQLRSLPQDHHFLRLLDPIRKLHFLAREHLLLCLFRESGVDQRVQFLLYHGSSPHYVLPVPGRLSKENFFRPSPRLELLFDYGLSPRYITTDVINLY